MNAIAIPVEFSSLDLFVPVGVNKYNVAIQLFKDSDALPYLDQAGIPNQSIITVTTLSPIFTVYIPVTPGAYNVTGRARIMPNNTDSVCYNYKSFTINQA